MVGRFEGDSATCELRSLRTRGDCGRRLHPTDKVDCGLFSSKPTSNGLQLLVFTQNEDLNAWFDAFERLQPTGKVVLCSDGGGRCNGVCVHCIVRDDGNAMVTRNTS